MKSIRQRFANEQAVFQPNPKCAEGFRGATIEYRAGNRATDSVGGSTPVVWRAKINRKSGHFHERRPRFNDGDKLQDLAHDLTQYPLAVAFDFVVHCIRR